MHFHHPGKKNHFNSPPWSFLSPFFCFCFLRRQIEKPADAQLAYLHVFAPHICVDHSQWSPYMHSYQNRLHLPLRYAAVWLRIILLIKQMFSVTILLSFPQAATTQPAKKNSLNIYFLLFWQYKPLFFPPPNPGVRSTIDHLAGNKQARASVDARGLMRKGEQVCG